MDLEPRIVLVVPYPEDHRPRTLVDDSPLGYYLAQSQRAGVIPCAPDDPDGCPVLVKHPNPFPGAPALVEVHFKLEPGCTIKWTPKYRGHRTLTLYQPAAAWNQARRAGLAHRMRKGDFGEAALAKRLKRTRAAGVPYREEV